MKECPHLSVSCGVPAVVMCSLSRQRLRLHLKTRARVTKSISVSSLSSSMEISSKAGWRRFVRGKKDLHFSFVCLNVGACKCCICELLNLNLDLRFWF